MRKHSKETPEEITLEEIAINEKNKVVVLALSQIETSDPEAYYTELIRSLSNALIAMHEAADTLEKTYKPYAAARKIFETANAHFQKVSLLLDECETGKGKDDVR